MDHFEALTTSAIANGELLGLVAIVLDATGPSLFLFPSSPPPPPPCPSSITSHHSHDPRNCSLHTPPRHTLPLSLLLSSLPPPLLSPSSSPLSLSTTLHLGAAGRWETPLALIQLVERKIPHLDDSVFSYIPELRALPIISASENHDGFTLTPRTKKLTWRHMLTHSSGLASNDHPLIEKWRAAGEPGVEKERLEDTPYIVRKLSMPLLFEPGEGWYYGESTHWLQLLFERVDGALGGEDGQRYVQYIRDHVFAPLGMSSSDYWARDGLKERRLELVERKGDGRVKKAKGELDGIICSVEDVVCVLGELLAENPRLVERANIDLMLESAFDDGSKALDMLRMDTEDYRVPAGINRDGRMPPVNFTLMGGLSVEGTLPLSKLPAGTVLWSGSANVVWAVNRHRGRGMLFATQLVPVDDEKVVELMLEFFNAALNTFW